MLFALLELLSVLLVILGTVTQVIGPLINGTPFFPAFRSKPSNVEAELELAKQKVKIAELENERDALLKQAEDLRKTPMENTNG